jgi:DNA modification methylase
MTEWVEIGPCKLACGDCLEILPEIEAGSVDAVVTDPPYKTRGGGGIVPIRGKGVAEWKAESYSVGEPWGFSLDWVDACGRFDPKHFVVFCNSCMLGELSHRLGQLSECGAVFVWQKPNAAPNCRNTPKWDCEFIVWHKSPKATNVRASDFRSQVIVEPFPQAGCFATERILEDGTKSALHPSQKPIAVVTPFIQNLTETGWTVLDCFMGLGTTGVACVQEQRAFVGIERDERYFSVACRRIRNAWENRQGKLF